MRRTLGRLRRLGAGAVSALVAGWLIGCGGDSPSGPQPPADGGVEPSAGSTEGALEHGALYRVCFPASWNGDLVFYAHSYVAPNQPLALPNDQLGGQPVSSTVTGLTTVGLLWYNVFGTADARARLGGQPFDNTSRVYTGSSNDTGLNTGVTRYDADPGALTALEAFETTGDLDVPVVTMHTTGDPVIPFEQEALYAGKVSLAGANAKLSQSSFDRPGHCAFQASEVLEGFTTLWQRIGTGPAAVASGD